MISEGVLRGNDKAVEIASIRFDENLFQLLIVTRSFQFAGFASARRTNLRQARQTNLSSRYNLVVCTTPDFHPHTFLIFFRDSLVVVGEFIVT